MLWVFRIACHRRSDVHARIHLFMLMARSISVEQVQKKRADENLADWIVHITTDADRQGNDSFVQAYVR